MNNCGAAELQAWRWSSPALSVGLFAAFGFELASLFDQLSDTAPAFFTDPGEKLRPPLPRDGRSAPSSDLPVKLGPVVPPTRLVAVGIIPVRRHESSRRG